jgi:hypothetical protein
VRLREQVAGFLQRGDLIAADLDASPAPFLPSLASAIDTAAAAAGRLDLDQ